MDFYNIISKEKKDGSVIIRPDWKVGRSKDLMVQGGHFYAIWDERAGLWSKDIYDVQRLVDAEMFEARDRLEEETGKPHIVETVQSSKTKLWDEFQRYLKNLGNNYSVLDERLTFSETEIKKEDHVSKRLGYSLTKGDCKSWDKLISTLYSQEERDKIEWAIGAIVSGEARYIQKFLVFYGPPGSGKSTILNIIQKLFDGYTSIFDARELVGSNNSFATSAFKGNPLVAIQHDGDLSRIHDNTKLNSIVAHEEVIVNEKYKAPYISRFNAMVMIGTNVPVKITDAKSGLIRRLIDVVPTHKTIDSAEYHILMERIDFELGAIADSCLRKFKQMGASYYDSYRPTLMMLQTDVFYNFIEANFDIFKSQDGTTLKQAWRLYKEYCDETGIDKVLPQYKLREELKNYFVDFHERYIINGERVRSYFEGFVGLGAGTPVSEMPAKLDGEYKIELKESSSVFDELYSHQPAQLATPDGTPKQKWDDVDTILKDIDTSKLHFVKVPRDHIIIDFDLTNEDGEKDLSVNVAAASLWPPTYAEVSKSGKGIHLHYTYSGDVEELASEHQDGVEVKTLLGNSSLRRQLTKHNGVTIAPIFGGLKKKEKPMISSETIKSEKSLRDLIERNLKKDIHPGTASSVDFIHKILDEAYDSGLQYDVTDMRGRILTFAAMSTNQSAKSIKLVRSMKFRSEEAMDEVSADDGDAIIFFDVEVYPNLFVVCWKYRGSDEVVRMVNPTPSEIEPLLSKKLVGFNNRRYDNHILYARFLGYELEELYNLSSSIINNKGGQSRLFGEAYNLSYTDIYDFSSKKQGLKKFQIELGIFHSELDIPWDRPVDESLWERVVEYCVNDVISTEKVFEARYQDFRAREILAELSGLSVNSTTQAHTSKIIFGNDRNHKSSFVYTDLSEMFEGYEFDGKESTYRNEITGEGGYVYAKPGVYENVALFDVESMHPTSIEQLNLFGKYTERFSELKEARMAIKHRDYEAASRMLDGKLAKFLEGGDDDAKGLEYALKIVINIVYGLTSAHFDNPFKDIRNKDNIVAKRGALFMVDAKHYLMDRGFDPIHIKTDSIKIPNFNEHPQIEELIFEFGKRYGYTFDKEAVYKKFCLVNEAVYVAFDGDVWTAVGAQFQHPYVFKQLFSKENHEFSDFCETRNVAKGTMYLELEEDGVSNLIHVGKTGSFVPVSSGGGTLWRINDDKKYAVTATKGYSWITRDMAISRDKEANLIVDMSYFDKLVSKAEEAITEQLDGDQTLEWFISKK